MKGESRWTLLLGAAGLVVSVAAGTYPIAGKFALGLSAVAICWALYPPMADVIKGWVGKRSAARAMAKRKTEMIAAAAALHIEWKRFSDALGGQKTYSFTNLGRETWLAAAGEVNFIQILLREVDIELAAGILQADDQLFYWLNDKITGFHYFIDARIQGRSNHYAGLSCGEKVGLAKFGEKFGEWKQFETEYNSALDSLRTSLAEVMGVNAATMFSLLRPIL